MKNKTYLYVGIAVLILGAVLISIPVANLALNTQQISAVSFLDRRL